MKNRFRPEIPQMPTHLDPVGKTYRCKRDTFDIAGRLIPHGTVVTVAERYLDVNVCHNPFRKISDVCLEKYFEEVVEADKQEDE